MLLSSNGNDSLHRHTFSVSVTESSQVGEARRLAVSLAQQLQFNESATGKVAIVATEAATNLVKHAKEGELLIRALDPAGVELMALDKGPGMANFERCLADGFSTQGTSGTGLGAIARQSRLFDVYSHPGGTALLARCLARNESPARSDLKIGAVNVPMHGETVCGDAWAVETRASGARVLVVDGLGHGPAAAQASQEAVRMFRASAGDPGLTLQDIHAALRSTRGAAVAIADVDFAGRSVRYAGVGNVVGVIVAGAKHQSLVSHNGTVGHQLHKVQEFNYTLPAGALLIMHSDGLSARWTLDAYPGLLARDPGLVAAVLYRDFKRGRDDATAVVVRLAASG